MSIFDNFRSKLEVKSPYLQYSAKARMYEDHWRFFVCSVRWIAETESLTVLNSTCDDEQLGLAVLRHLAEYDATEFDLSGRKKADWPAFQASDAKSVSAFERSLWSVDLAIMNSAVLIWASPANTLNDCELSAFASANRYSPEGVGTSVRKALLAAKALRAQGLV